MVWNLEDNPDTLKERKIYKYVLKQSRNSIFSNNIIKFLDVYDYLKDKNYSSAEELRQDILSNGKPFLTISECEKILDMISMKGGSGYPIVDNIARVLLEWVYKWSPKTVGIMVDFYIPKLRHFSAIFIPPELKEIYDMTMQILSVIIRENVISFQQTSEETGFFPSLAHYVMVLLLALFMVLVNVVHVTNDDFGAVLIDMFLIIPVLGPSLYTLAVQSESKLQSVAESRKQLIELMRTEYKDEDSATFLNQFLPDIENVQKLKDYQIPLLPDLQKARDIFVRLLSNPENAETLKRKISEYARKLEPEYLNQANKDSLKMLGSKYPAIQQVGGKRFTSGHHYKKKWGTQRKLKI